MNDGRESPKDGWNWRAISGCLLAAYWLAMFAGTHVPRPPELLTIEHGDKYLHTSAYAGLAVLCGWYLATRGPLVAWHYGAIFVVLVLYGAADELLQIPVNRHADVADWLADAGGIMLGLTVFWILSAVWRRLSR